MTDFEQTAYQFQQLLTAGQMAEAERLVDDLAAIDPDELGKLWGFGKSGARHYLAIFFNNIGSNYQGRGIQAHQQNDRAGMQVAAERAERCHEKAIDMYDISAEDFIYFPAHSPFNKNLIFTLWGLGSAKYVLGKNAESQKYLLLCLRFPPEDEQAIVWQSDASNYLRLLDRKPIQIALKAHSIMPTLLNPQMLRVEGELLEWGAYTKPRFKEYLIAVTDEEIDALAAKGFRNAIALEGHILVLRSHDSGDLRRPLRIVEVV